MKPPLKRPAGPETRAARPRLGPRPLPLHLGLAVLAWQSSKAALPLLKTGSLPWTADLVEAAGALRQNLAGSAPDAFEHAVAREIDRRYHTLLSGLQAYRAHPYRRNLREPPAVWQEGTSRLLDYAPDSGAPNSAAKGEETRTPVLVVPSLINRAYILDLNEQTSLLRWLASRGFRPFLMDWDRPDAEERGFSLSDYVAGRLERALDHVLAQTGRRPHLIGYCMGGLLALALAVRRGEDLGALALLATPWDFHAEQAAQARLVGDSLVTLAPLMALQGELPVDVIQGLFASLDPLQVIKKFIAFSSLAPDDPGALRFVAVEDWLNDGVPLAAQVAHECLGDWYTKNVTAKGDWRIGGESILPERVSLPSLCILPGQDRIVPPASAAALAQSLPGAKVFRPAVGHVGMIVSAVAERRVWQPLADWLADPAP
jgi:polyhydroxyalkanoate synthase